MQSKSNDDAVQTSTQDAMDIAMLMKSDFHIGTRSIHRITTNIKPFWVRFNADGWIGERLFVTALFWRTFMMYSLTTYKSFEVLEMDEPFRLADTFSPHIMARLNENAEARRDVVPVAKLIDPAGTAEVVVVRSRCQGNAVDIFHNLSAGGPVFQPVWIADLMRLNPKVGLKLVLDKTFQPTMTVDAYLEAAAITGRIVVEPEFASLPLTGQISLLRTPPAIPTVQSQFNRLCLREPKFEALRNRTIYDDYRFFGRDAKVR